MFIPRLGTFYAPALPGLNVVKLLVMLYMRSWAVLMCNIPHERIFKASRSNNFYLVYLCTILPSNVDGVHINK